MFVRELGFKSLVNEIVRELMASTENTQDSSSIRSFSNFLVEVAELEPEIMIPTTKELSKYLEQDVSQRYLCLKGVNSLLSHLDLKGSGSESTACQRFSLGID
jgi:hypothetical protein